MRETPYDIEWRVERFHWWFTVRRKLLESILSSFSLPGRGLAVDMGCGVGSNLEVLRSMGFQVVGLDKSIYALSFVQRRSPFPLINADLNKLPVRSQSIDFIVAMDVLEHLKDDVLGIRQFYQVLKEGGMLFVTVPAFQFLWGIQDVVTAHQRRYSKKEILNKLRQEKFRILRFSYFNFFLFFPIFLARRMIRLLGLRLESENEVNPLIVNFFLKLIFSLEPHMLRYVSFPFGVSMFCMAKK